MTSFPIDNLSDAQRLLEQQKEELERKNRELEQQKAETQHYKEQLTKLESRVEWLTRQVFGRKSERLGPDDLALFQNTQWLQEEQEAEKPQPKPQRERISYEREKPAGKRKPLPEDLPRVNREHDLPEEEKFCPETGKPLVKWIGQEEAEQLAYQPASAYVIRHIQHKYARLEENLDGTKPEVVTAEKPREGLAKSIAAPSLLAAVMVSKFADHIPLHRLEKMLKRSGISTPRSSMCRWVQEVAEMLQALVVLMEASILRSGTIQGDDTPTKQQEPGSGKTRTCRFWSYVGDGITGGRYVVYRYTTDRSRDGPEGFFTDANGNARYHGKLQCDAYAGFGRLFEARSKWKLTEIGCWAHVRRKFYDARLAAPRDATWMMKKKIGRLYDIERRAKRWNLSAEQRRTLRERRARPIVDEIFAWCEESSGHVLPKSKLGEAIEYLRNRGEALRRYLEDGHLEIDNNDCERSLRGIAIGRKNWLFTGSEAGGHAAAVLFSLIGSCHLHGVNPLAYLTDVITRLPETPQDELEQLLPDRWAAAQAAASNSS